MVRLRFHCGRVGKLYCGWANLFLRRKEVVRGRRSQEVAVLGETPRLATIEEYSVPREKIRVVQC